MKKIIDTKKGVEKCECGLIVEIRDFIEFQPEDSPDEPMDHLNVSFEGPFLTKRDFLRIGICVCGNIFFRRYERYDRPKTPR